MRTAADRGELGLPPRLYGPAFPPREGEAGDGRPTDAPPFPRHEPPAHGRAARVAGGLRLTDQPVVAGRLLGCRLGARSVARDRFAPGVRAPAGAGRQHWPRILARHVTVLGDDVSAGDAARRPGPLADRADGARPGLTLDRDDACSGAVPRSCAHEGLLNASDPAGRGRGPDHVAGRCTGRRRCWRAVTERRHVRRAHDIRHLGNGIQAAARRRPRRPRGRHGTWNERALTYAEFNMRP
jgi:hypothetical protein